MDCRPTPEEETPSETLSLPSIGARGTGRASMREEFLALFRDTDQASPTPPSTPETANEPQPPAGAQSVFLRRFLRLGACSAELAPSGLADLDDRLAGGFGFGLHLVLGLPGVGKTAFLESVAWEAVSGERPVLYYTLRDGGSGTWKRLISTLGHIIDGPTIPLDALHAHALSPPDLETLTRLDLVLQASVLPYLSLVETIPAYTDTLSAFIEDVRLRAQEVKEQHGKIPLLLIDDLDRLLLVTRAHPLPLLLSRLDQVLAADSRPGLLTATVHDSSSCDLERLPIQAVLALAPASASATDALARVDLELRTNALTGWTGTLPLLRDRCSGLFTHPSAGTPSAQAEYPPSGASSTTKMISSVQ
jgi:hypothetical protein